MTSGPENDNKRRVKGRSDAADPAGSHAIDRKEHIQVTDRAPETFAVTDGPYVTLADPSRYLVRVFNVTGFYHRWARRSGLKDPVATLRQGIRERDAGTRGSAYGRLTAFMAHLGRRMDRRPTPAGFLDEVRAEADADDWYDRLRDVFGLAHMTGEPGDPAILVQLRYPVSAVTNAPPQGERADFAAPTVLDGGLWPWFHPSPGPAADDVTPCGKAVRLSGGDERPVSEILHRTVTPLAGHVHDVAAVTTAPAAGDVLPMRDRHVRYLRDITGRTDFGVLWGNGDETGP